MDLAHKIAQLLIVGFKGDRLQPGTTLAADLRDRALGGVILFDRLLAEKSPVNNIVSASQTARLCAELQDCAGGRLLIAVDQEGGMVSRFKAERGFPTTVSASRLGESGDVGLTGLNAACTAEMLGTLGINLNLAPVVDLELEPDNPIIARYERSFAADPGVVARHAAAWITAHRRRRILTCLKHFPGHGSSRTDSHLGFVDISASWQEEELEPYRTLIADGLADLVMVGHLCHRGIDPELPATLSPAAIDGRLRRDLGFAGAVITDDLQMRAITDRYGLAEACIMALTAGADILIIGNTLQYDPQMVGRITAALVAAVRQGRLAEARIDSAWHRVRQLQTFIHR